MTDADDGTVGYDAVVLAGGAGRRLGGLDKALVDVGGQPLLARVLAAVKDAERRICVGPERAGFSDVIWCRETPPGGGPVAGLAAALPFVRAETVVLLAVDLPLLDAATVRSLAAAVGELDGAVAVDESGREQTLLAAYRVSALRAVLDRIGAPAGARMRDLVVSLRLARLPVGPAAADCDTAEDLRAARAEVEGSRP
jgi:molybdopterin-guanine dinucleotide biosynthesis protein A